MGKPSLERQIEALLDVTSTAAVLGQTEHWVRKRIERRQLPFKKLGFRVYIPAAELRAFIAALPGVSADEALQRMRGGE